ncbi:MAG TPA: 23S rRNA (uracil(1939)-C(5))-methyltransferase RlmD [Candidatus Dormibacteraeota bacterium]|nr:23S rRNA (uracil(1939)-C(5))-methyltransferase RlmD [Candidatus Dormibacteraeota bacterium]
MEVRIEKLVYGGDGLAHHDGQTVFVPLVLPGELVRIESATRKKKFVRGRLEQVLEASPERIAAPCPHFGRCGGCQYQHIPYEAQVRYKTEILRETLGRTGRIQWTGPIEAHASPPFGYRNRAQWKLRPRKDGAADLPGIGYFEAGSTRLCPVDECAILSPRLAETFAQLRALVASSGILSAIDEIEAFADSANEKVLLNLSADRLTDSAESIAAALRRAVPNAESILIQDRHADTFGLFGPGFLTYSAGGAEFRVGHLSFFQVNRYMVDTLVDAVLGDSRGRLALDLFAGVGLFAVPLTSRFDRVIGVEANLAAAKDLEVNLQASGGKSPTPRHATAEAFLMHWHETPDLVVLDPPRAGLDPDLLTQIKKLNPWRINYVSCDPATLARDLAGLVGSGEAPGPYEIRDINLFDIFPQTYHMEVLVRLKRRT